MNLRFLVPLVATAVLAPTLYAEVHSTVFIDDLSTAKEKAQASHKDIFVSFTGSDWCGWCITLEKEVFDKLEFKVEAPNHLDLVQLDFPHDKTKQTPEIQARNKAWKSELKSSSFPDALLLDEKGRVFARTGYREGGAKAYLVHLEELRQRRIRRDEALSQGDTVVGIEKAKHLDAALSALRNDEVLATYYNNEIKQILSLDSKDEAGLQTKYKQMFKRLQCEREILSLWQGADGQVMLAHFKEYAARQDAPLESRQYAIYMAAALACERMLKDYPQALELLKQAEAMNPDSELAQGKLSEAKKRLERKKSKSIQTKAGGATPPQVK